MRNLCHLGSSRWRWRGLGWSAGIRSDQLRLLREKTKQAREVRVNWLKGGKTLVQEEGILVTMRHIMRPVVLGKVIKVSHGRRKEAIIKDKRRREIIMTIMQRGGTVIIGKRGVIKVVMRDTSRTGEEPVALKNQRGCGKTAET